MRAAISKTEPSAKPSDQLLITGKPERFILARLNAPAAHLDRPDRREAVNMVWFPIRLYG
jgi:hypothetical protein